MVRTILDGKGAFYKGSESDDSDNDDGNYNNIMIGSSYLSVLPIVAT